MLREQIVEKLSEIKPPLPQEAHVLNQCSGCIFTLGRTYLGFQRFCQAVYLFLKDRINFAGAAYGLCHSIGRYMFSKVTP